MPDIIFFLNFVFVLDNNQQTTFSNFTYQELHTAASQQVLALNYFIDNTGIIPPSIAPVNPSPLVSNPKIGFQLNGVFQKYSSTAIHQYNAATNPYPLGYYDTYNENGENILNIFIYPSSSAPNYAAFANFYKAIYIPFLTSISHPKNVKLVSDDLLAHELGHALAGLAEGYDYFNTCVNQWVAPVPNRNPYYSVPCGFGSVFLGYFPDDASGDQVPPPVNCSSTSNPINNQIMGAYPCADHFSARQLAAFHYRVATGQTKKFTQFNGGTYPYIVPSANNSSNTNIDLTGTQIITSITSINNFNVLTIKAGADITLDNLYIKPAYNSKIVIEPNAKLTLRCVKMGTPCRDYWQGIEVWGSPYNPQLASNLTNVYPFHGYLKLIDSEISGAKIGVLSGKRAGSSAAPIFDPQNGGGIIIAENSQFIDNELSIRMRPHGGNSQFGSHLSTFENCNFATTTSAYCRFYPFELVLLEGVKNVKFYDCNFSMDMPDGFNDTTICIKGYNSNIICKKKENNYDVGNFGNAFFGIHMTNGQGNVIKACFFTTRNGIHITNSTFDEITYNRLRPTNCKPYGFSNSLRTAIYLNKSTNFKVENNEMISNHPTIPTTGVCVNNSGPTNNQITNNAYVGLSQGLWCQNQNYSPSSPFKIGLRATCNDFLSCKFCIGVQTPFVSTLCDLVNFHGDYWNWQASATLGCLNGGIAEYQGNAISSDPWDYARNSFVNVTASNYENKYYSYTPMSVPPVVQYGRFAELSVDKHKVGPQPTYSNPLDVSDLVGMNAPVSREGFCPPLFSWSPEEVWTNFDVGLNHWNSVVSTKLNVYNQKIDGGNTGGLLTDVVSGMSSQQLRDILLNEDFLSDEVLTSYINLNTWDEADFLAVIHKNAPLSRTVWHLLGSYQDSSFYQVLESYQFDSAQPMSERQKHAAPIAIAMNERQYTVTNKAIQMLQDTLTEHKEDSLKKLIVDYFEGDIEKMLIDLDISTGNYVSASERLALYNPELNDYKQKYVDYKNLYLQTMQDSLQLQSLLMDANIKSSFVAAASDIGHPCTEEAQGLLFYLFRTPANDPHYTPETDDDFYCDLEGSQQSRVKRTVNALSPESASEKSFSIHPNPAGDKIFVSGILDCAELKVYNVTGQLVLTIVAQPSDLMEVNVNSLSNGLYFVTLNEAPNRAEVKKLVIAR